MNIKKLILLWMVIFFVQMPGRTGAYTITILGTGYVGLITGACLADLGHEVICADTDRSKIELLMHGTMPIYEPGLKELVVRNKEKGRLSFTYDINTAADKADCIFIAVGTPMDTDGYADLTALYSAFHMILPFLTRYKIICIKSTVPVGTGDHLLALLKDKEINNTLVDVVSNPEFLREGSAISDFMNPDRIVIGTYSENARELMRDLYEPLLEKNVPCIFTSLASSETIKYASNAFLASKLSFINEIANLCDQTGADIVDVALGMGLDKRIGQAFLRPGPGFGGSCFPKDCHALCNMGKLLDVKLNMVSAALITNEEQKKKPIQKLMALMDDELNGKTVAILGLAFKGNTDDVRYSPAITTIELLLQAGANVKAYDPVAMSNMAKLFPTISYCNSTYEAASDAHAVIIMTEWDEFKYIDIALLSELMQNPILVDMRNLLDPAELQKHNFAYALMGRP